MIARKELSMINRVISKEEQEYLDSYDLSAYKQPSLAADIAIFSILPTDKNSSNYRKDSEENLNLLLIKRGQYPHKGEWALPGGFCQENEDVYESAMRELTEETGVENSYLKLIGSYGAPNRDPRGWIISNTFLALIDGTKQKVNAGSDAKEAMWFNVSLSCISDNKVVNENEVIIDRQYALSLTSNDATKDNICLSSTVTEHIEFKNLHETVSYDITGNDGLAFDHAMIISRAILSLRESVESSGKIVFDLMPEKFTLAQLQNAFEIILSKPLLTPNFRRKMAPLVIETDEMSDGVGHRPAKYFVRNIEAFY